MDDASPQPPHSHEEPKKTPEETGGAEARGALAGRVRIPRREFLGEAKQSLPADQAQDLWAALALRCPGRPHFEGTDVFLLIGGLMILYGAGWTLDKVYDLVGLLVPSLAAAVAALLAARQAETWWHRDRAEGPAAWMGFLAALLATGAMLGLIEATDLDVLLGRSRFTTTALGTLVAAGPIAITGRLLWGGLHNPRLLSVFLAAASCVLGAWTHLLLDPSWKMAWALATAYGLALLRFGYAIDRRSHVDMAAAPYEFGLALVWGIGLCAMPWRGELAWVAYAAGNLVLMSLAAALSRGVFLACGALGVYAWLGHLAFSVFRGALLFPFVLTALGLMIMGSGLWYQRNREAVAAWLEALLPAALRPELPDERPAPPRPRDEAPAAAPEGDAPTPRPRRRRASRLDLSESDLLELGPAHGLDEDAAAALWQRLDTGNPIRARLTVAHILYFLGALTVIGAMTFFMGLCWSTMGVGSIFLLSLGYAAAFYKVGTRFWQEDETKLPGGLLVTMAVAMVPLTTFAFQATFGLWPGGAPGEYQGLFHYVKGGWFLLEVATLAAGLAALRKVRFPFLTAPISFTLWFMSMDLAPLLLGEGGVSWQERCWVSVVFGLGMLLVSWAVDRRTQADYSFWGYLFGVLTFWGGLTGMRSGSELGRFLYALVNLGMMLVGAALGRQVFLFFGFLGFHGYLAWQFYRLFKDVPGFPLLVAGAGLGVLAFGRWLERRLDRWEAA